MKLRKAEIKDANFLFEMKNEKGFQKYFPSRIIPKNLKEQEKEIKEAEKLSKKKQFFVFIAEEKEKIGYVDLYKVNMKDNRCAIGFGVKKEFWKRSFGTKIVKEILIFIKTELKLHTVEATVFPGNIASEKVLKKNGFTKVGLMKDYYYSKDKYVDRILYWKVL